MADHPPGQGPGDRPMPEPPVRRWSHPVEGASVPRQAAPTLHYICCALSYQNQTLADINFTMPGVEHPILCGGNY